MHKKNEIYLDNYEKVSDEIKHITNSVIRLHLLFSLFESNMTMKEINDATGLSYSAISTNVHALESTGFITREGNKYFLSNDMEFYLKNLNELNKTINILEIFNNLFENHKVRGIPNDLISEIHMIEDSNLLESSGINAYKINKIILNNIKKSDSLKAIIPINFQDLTDSIGGLLEKGKKVELKIAKPIYKRFTENINVKSSNLKINEIEKDFNFLLIISDKTTMLGLYKKDGSYDQNRILISQSPESLKWAQNLFKSI